MGKLLELANERAAQIRKGIQKAEHDELILPEGRLRSSRGERCRRYFRMTEKNDTKGRYIPSAQRDLIKGLAQRDYSRQYLKAAKAELSALEKAIEFLSKGGAEAAFEGLPEYRKELVAPYYKPSYVYAAEWQALDFRTNPLNPGQRRYLTRKGELVRSKSEAIIADILFELGIPYHYEKELRLKNGKIRYPDFTLLKVSERKVFYLEHLGLLDNEEYRKSCLVKFDEYRKSGIYFGENLIITYESEDNPLDIGGIRKMLTDIFCD